jgi:YD repeat-containing protein
LDATGTNATITWTSGGGPVTNYQIWFGSWSTGLNSNTFSFKYNGLIPGDTDINSPFTVRARFANGAYADSEPAYVCAAALSSSMAAVRGPGGQLYLAVGSVPPDLSVIRLYWQVWDSNVGAYVYHSIDLSAASLVNGAAPLPLDQMTGYDPGTWFDAQCIATNALSDGGNYGQIFLLVEPSGRWEKYQYDSAGRLTYKVAQFGNNATTTLDSSNRVTQVTYSGNIITTVESLLGNEVARTYEVVNWDEANAIEQIQTIRCATSGAGIGAGDNLTNIVWQTTSAGNSASTGHAWDTVAELRPDRTMTF